MKVELFVCAMPDQLMVLPTLGLQFIEGNFVIAFSWIIFSIGLEFYQIRNKE